MNPTFSIIMTSFNYAPYVGAAIESILAQTFQDWELLIVDDCSTDDSWRIIQKFKDPRIKAHRHQVNLGACAAYNQALPMARGEYIACLDSDDLFMTNKLERQAEFLAQHPDVDICGSYLTEIDPDGAIVSGTSAFVDWFNVQVDLNDPASWVWENRLCHSSAVVRRDLHCRLGNFDNSLIYTPDWQFWIRALVSDARFSVIEEPLVAYRSHGGNITKKNKHEMLVEHAGTVTRLLIPWLKQQGRHDLITVILEGFLGNLAPISTGDLQSRVVEVLFSGKEAADIGASIMRLALRKEANLVEVLKGKDWLESQWNACTVELLAKDAYLAEVLKGKDWLESQWKAAQAELLASQGPSGKGAMG